MWLILEIWRYIVFIVWIYIADDLKGHYGDIMGTIASQITSLLIVYSTFYSDADPRKHQSSVSLVFEQGIHRWPVNFPHKGPVTRKNVSIWWRHHGQSAMLPAFKTISYSPEIRGCFLYIGSDHVIKTSVNEIMHIMSTGTLFQMKLHFVGIFVYNHKPVISKIISGIHIVSISCEIALRWMLCKTSLMIRWYWHHGTKPLPEPMFYDAIWHHQVTTS